ADEKVPADLSVALGSSVRSTVMTANATDQKVDLEALGQGTQVEERLLTSNSEDRGSLDGIGMAMGLLYYLMALIFGIQIAQSVVQERESRVVEILAAAVPSRTLLWGKVAANTLLAVGQAALLVTAALITMKATGMNTVLSGAGPALAWYLAYFLIGFVALTALWSAAGTLAGRTADVNSTTMPMQIILVAGYFAGAFTSGTSQVVASLIPVISPMVMPYRIALGEAPLWQVLLGLALNVVAAFVLIRLGARIYDRHLLQTGRKIGFAEALRG
ncbi:MAG: ABC transporter permease, partial [Myxococcales bacterium]